MIHELPWARSPTARVDGKEPIPRLDELLGAFPDRARSTSTARPTPSSSRSATCCDAADRPRPGLRRRRSATCRLRALAPALRAAAVHQRRAGRARRCCGSSASPHPACGRPRCRSTRRASRSRRRRSSGAATGAASQVHVWTIDDAAEMDELLDLGVDGIMTDRPAVLKDVLVRRSAVGDVTAAADDEHGDRAGEQQRRRRSSSPSARWPGPAPARGSGPRGWRAPTAPA